MVEFIIFSPSQSLQNSLDRPVGHCGCEQTLVDPFNLLIIVLDDVFQQVDTAIHHVLVVFRQTEKVGIRCVHKHMIRLMKAVCVAVGSAKAAKVVIRLCRNP